MASKSFNFSKAAGHTRPAGSSAQSALLTLIGGSAQPVQPLPLSLLQPHPEQQRYHMDAAAIDWLAESIKVMGVLQPIIVRQKADGYYEILAGHRRTAAAKQAELNTIPALVYADLDDDSAAYIFHVTNLGQRDVRPSEKAYGYQEVLRVLESKGLLSGQTTAAIAAETGDDVRTIQRYKRLNELTSSLLDAVDRGDLSIRAAGELSYLSEKQQDKVAEKINDGEKVTQQDARLLREQSKKATAPKSQAAKPRQEVVRIPLSRISHLLPHDCTAKQAVEEIIDALERRCEADAAD